MVALRAGFKPAERSEAGRRVAAAVLALPELARPRQILAYAATARELPTGELIDALLAAGHAVAVPAMTAPPPPEAPGMRAWRLGPLGLRSLVPGPFGVLAPPPETTHPPGRAGRDSAWMKSPQVALVPGLAFDLHTGVRLGRGGGHYDRWLAEHPEVVAIGLGFDGQRLAGVPHEAHDRRMDLLATPGGVWRFPRIR